MADGFSWVVRLRAVPLRWMPTFGQRLRDQGTNLNSATSRILRGWAHFQVFKIFSSYSDTFQRPLFHTPRLASDLKLGGFVGSIGFVPTDSKGWTKRKKRPLSKAPFEETWQFGVLCYHSTILQRNGVFEWLKSCRARNGIRPRRETVEKRANNTHLVP